MTGFDETVPLDPDPSSDGTAVDTGSPETGTPGTGTAEQDGTGTVDERLMGGDDDIAAGHLDE